ncbi:TetR family transcriptional regulator [Mycobacterium aquaticum]|uniref:TetR family transcriptional regulator n=1 Tax=Mycobacterium aquaticum TaxID=1927124 RepID=A0A1X0B1B6_9MYCO|nr:TetR family transcriptional regulator [Mycobacterium aquaticum]
MNHPYTLSVVAEPPRRKDAVFNREHIIGVARELVDDGVPLQLNDVARRAGVGVATVYRHFPTTTALLEAVAAPCLEALIGYGEQALIAADPGHAFGEFLSHVVEAQVTDASLPPVNAAHADELPYTTELKARLRTVGSALLDRAREAGAVRADLTDDDLIPLMCGIAYAAVAHPGPPAARRYVEMLLTGLRTR